MAYDQSIRSLMNSAGYSNDKIGYDPNSNTVTYDNRPFYKGGMNVNGTVFTDKSAFDNAHNQYQQSYGQGTIFTPQDNNLSYDQRLANYAQNPTAAAAEFNRASQVSAYNQATGTNNADTVAHINRLQQIMSAQKPQGPDVNGLVNSVYQRVMNPQAYDVYSSPEYQAAKQHAEYGAQQAINSGLESLGTSGMARSSDAINFARNAEQQAQNDLISQVVPQLIAQHRAQEQQQLGNLTSLISPLLQQQQMATDNSHWDKTFDYGKQKDERDYNYQVGRDEYSKSQDAIKNNQWQQTFDYGKEQDSISNSRADRQLNATIANMNADNARANAAAAAQKGDKELAMKFDIWEKTGVAPDGIPGVAKGTPLAGKSGLNGIDMQAEVDGLMGSLRAGKLTPESALQQLEEDFSFGHYTKPQYDQLRTTIARVAPNYSKPVTMTPEQENELPSDKELDKMVPKGVPVLDWKSWYKDPKGRSAGLSFEDWHQLYGPRLEAKR